MLPLYWRLLSVPLKSVFIIQYVTLGFYTQQESKFQYDRFTAYFINVKLQYCITQLTILTLPVGDFSVETFLFFSVLLAEFYLHSVYFRLDLSFEDTTLCASPPKGS